jgi:DNA-binding NarL/FixJ family response regulator
MTGEDETRRIRVMLVEDHPDFRRLMEDLLGGQSDIKLVAQAGSLAEARKHAAVVRFDVAVLDLGFPDGNGVDLIPDLRRANSGVGVLILSVSLDPASLERAVEEGADEIMDKLAPLDEVLGTVRRLGARKRPDVRRPQVRPSPTTLVLLRTSTRAALRLVASQRRYKGGGGLGLAGTGTLRPRVKSKCNSRMSFAFAPQCGKSRRSRWP